MLSNARENTPATPGELPSPGISASPNRSHRFAAANRATRGRESCYLRPRVALPAAAHRQLVKLFGHYSNILQNNSQHHRRSPTPYSKFTAVIELFVLGASSSGLPNVPASSSIFCCFIRMKTAAMSQPKKKSRTAFGLSPCSFHKKFVILHPSPRGQHKERNI